MHWGSEASNTQFYPCFCIISPNNQTIEPGHTGGENDIEMLKVGNIGNNEDGSFAGSEPTSRSTASIDCSMNASCSTGGEFTKRRIHRWSPFDLCRPRPPTTSTCCPRCCPSAVRIEPVGNRTEIIYPRLQAVWHLVACKQGPRPTSEPCHTEPDLRLDYFCPFALPPLATFAASSCQPLYDSGSGLRINQQNYDACFSRFLREGISPDGQSL
jgi:hypothetical protein